MINQFLKKTDFVIVGAGFYGCTMAERIATILKKRVVIIEAREHIGGNAYSYKDQTTGIEIHRYGSHIFHTNSEKVWTYINQFTKFNQYTHKVFSVSNNKLYSLPFSLLTLSQVYGKVFTPSEAEAKFQNNLVSKKTNFEDFAIESVGKELYELLIKGYTQKQWQQDPKELPAEIIARLPIRFNYDNRYFHDIYQGIPVDGYGSIFENMLESKNIVVINNTDFHALNYDFAKPVIYTGPIDSFYKYKYGYLNWRTLDFENQIINKKDFQGNAVINYPDLNVPYTRIHEYKHFDEKFLDTEKTLISKEFSRKAEPDDEPYYPVNLQQDRLILSKYRNIRTNNVHFGGRLATYKYLDMHMAIASALQNFENLQRGF